MLLTEEEAKKKWCPMVQMGYTKIGDVSMAPDNRSGNCIASNCMMWRQSDGNKGYCGLAGSIIYRSIAPDAV